MTGIQGQTCPLYSAFHIFHLVQFSTHSCPILCNPMDCSTPGLPSITNSWSLLKLMSIESMMITNHLILIIPFSSCLQSFPASGFFPMSRFFPSGGQSIGASTSACHSNEYSGLISFKIDWFDLLAVQGTLKSLLQHNSQASIIRHLAFFMVQLSHPHLTSRKTISSVNPSA